MGDEDSEEKLRVEVTVPRRHAERLEREYTGANSLPEALRQASEEALRHRERELTQEDVATAIVDALEQSNLAPAGD